ncbi:hypothetical protein ASE14_09390 [Agromyces sp. Root81]|uniref:hypothetical protein n=1 Tax=Agromyces sp. Root81 TaxID=1736601 RepID=UPI0006FE9728|nr:hypothetical protein [Agromyces sp. Root81]KRC61136.1 hypothetical protein ASE14_09390 [Agromyces sp. Root81]
MLISEIAFPHLVAANDERVALELERRRVALERRAESAATEAAALGAAPAVVPAATAGRAPRHAASRRHQTHRMPRPAA